MTFKKPQIHSSLPSSSGAGFSAASSVTISSIAHVMAMDNLDDEDKLHASTSLPQRSEEHGCNLLTNDSASIGGVASNYLHSDNVPRISQSNRGIAPSGGTLMINSSQINDLSSCTHHMLREFDCKSLLLHRPNSGFLYQHAPFNLNSSEILDSGRNAPSNSGSNTNAEINSEFFGINLACESTRGFVPQFSTHHSIMDSRRFLYPDSDRNGAISGYWNNNELMNDLRQNTDVWMLSTDNHNPRPGIRMGLQPSLPSGRNQIMQRGIRTGTPSIPSGSNQIMNPGIGKRLPSLPSGSNQIMHPGIGRGSLSLPSGSSQIMHPGGRVGTPSLPSGSNQIMHPDARIGTPSLPSGSNQIMHPNTRMGTPSLPSGSNQIMLHDTTMGTPSLPSGSNRIMHPNTRMGTPSFPSGSNQTMQCDIKQSKASGHTVFSSPGMESNRPLSRQLPDFSVNSNGNFSLQSSTPPLGTATGRTSRMDPSSLGMQTGMRNMIPQVSRLSDRSSLKRGASEAQLPLAQACQRKTPPILPSAPTSTGSAPLLPYTTQTIFPSSHKAIPPISQATVSTVHPPTFTRARTALSPPNTSQTIPASMRPSQPDAVIPPLHYDKRILSSLPGFHIISSALNTSQTIPPLVRTPQPRAVTPPPHYDKRMPSSLPGPQVISPPPLPQMSRSLPHPRWRPPHIMSSAIKHEEDETLKPLGYNCCLCKRDLSFTPEGSILLPSPPPEHAVLACHHTFHFECLKKITPKDQENDPNPTCIACALGE